MVRESIELKEFTTMKTGGSARYFFAVKNTEDVKEAVFFAKEKNLPIFVLGGGSNVVISDEGFEGVVIKMEIKNIEFKEIDKNTSIVSAGAGVEWDDLVEKTVNKNLYGLENLSLIPGTVGASPVQNIGAYGVEAGDVILYVEVLNVETMSIKKISNKECLFGYRDSLFKTKEGKKFIILSVAFKLKKDGELNMEYKDIKDYFKINKIKPTLKSLRRAIVEIRKSKLPDINKIGTAGSFFKNPIVSKNKIEEIIEKYSDARYFPDKKGFFKVSAAWLLDNVSGCKGVCVGGACVYEHHALVLINKGGATTKEIIFLSDKIIQDVKNKTGIVLEYEVNIIE